MSETVSRDFTVDRRSCLKQLVETSRWTQFIVMSETASRDFTVDTVYSHV